MENMLKVITLFFTVIIVFSLTVLLNLLMNIVAKELREFIEFKDKRKNRKK